MTLIHRILFTLSHVFIHHNSKRPLKRFLHLIAGLNCSSTPNSLACLLWDGCTCSHGRVQIQGDLTSMRWALWSNFTSATHPGLGYKPSTSSLTELYYRPSAIRTQMSRFGTKCQKRLSRRYWCNYTRHKLCAEKSSPTIPNRERATLMLNIKRVSNKEWEGSTFDNFRWHCEGEMMVWNDYGSRTVFKTMRGVGLALRQLMANLVDTLNIKAISRISMTKVQTVPSVLQNEKNHLLKVRK